VWLFCCGSLAAAQAAPRPGGPAGAPPASPRASAVIDITGYWVSIVDEDWVVRETTPARSDYGGVPLNEEGRRVTDAWDPEKDTAAGNDCRAYGAGNIMRIPERLHITWVDDRTLQIETDAGMQKRLFHFGASTWQGGEPGWQGESLAAWEKQIQTRSNGDPFGGPEPGKGGNLHVVTTHMRPGYLAKNGVPYSGSAVLNEHFRMFDLHDTAYMIVTSVMEDPVYLRESYALSGQFKREPDGSKWDPSPCRPLWPLSLRAIVGRTRRERERAAGTQ
jgi:hypothetical protein